MSLVLNSCPERRKFMRRILVTAGEESGFIKNCINHALGGLYTSRMEAILSDARGALGDDLVTYFFGVYDCGRCGERGDVMMGWGWWKRFPVR